MFARLPAAGPRRPFCAAARRWESPGKTLKWRASPSLSKRTFKESALSTQTITGKKLAINGGDRTVTWSDRSLFHWPIVTAEDEAAVVDVMRTAGFSGTNITKEFEKEYA